MLRQHKQYYLKDPKILLETQLLILVLNVIELRSITFVCLHCILVSFHKERKMLCINLYLVCVWFPAGNVSNAPLDKSNMRVDFVRTCVWDLLHGAVIIDIC